MVAAQCLTSLMDDPGVPRKVVLLQAAANGATACADQGTDPGEI